MVIRKYLDNGLNKFGQLESTFVEIINKGKKNTIIGCIYRHPCMDIDDFNVNFEELMEKISSENKEVFLVGDFENWKW